MRGIKGSTGPCATTARYRQGCRCAGCRAAKAAYERHRRRDRARRDRRGPLVDAGRAREHVRELMASARGKTDGIGYERLADLAGISRGIVRALLYGVSGRPPSRRIRRENEVKILAVGPEMPADGATVDAGEARALVACLLAFGVTRTRIGRAMGTSYPGVRVRDRITVRRTRGIERLHWGLWRQHNPFRRHCACKMPGRVHRLLEERG